MQYSFLFTLLAAGFLHLAAVSFANAQAVPISLVRDHVVVVHGNVGDLKKLNFIVDTGGRTILDRSIAEKLHLHGAPSQTHVIDGDLRGTDIFLPEIGIGPVQQRNFPVTVLDLSDLQRELGTRIDALVGLDLLAGHSFRIEYIAQRIVFGPVCDREQWVDFQKDGSFLVLKAEYGGQHLNLMLDTGTSALVLFRQRGLKTPSSEGESQGANLMGHFKLSEIAAPGVRLGQAEFRNPAAFFTDDRHLSQYQFDGLLGVSGLCVREIAVDFERGRFSWEPQGADSSCNPTYARLRLQR